MFSKSNARRRNRRETGGSFWTALAERSGDSAFGGNQSGVALRLPPHSKFLTPKPYFKNLPWQYRECRQSRRFNKSWATARRSACRESGWRQSRFSA
jgi:hypothetical protein